MHGVLIIDKHEGVTSAEVVRIVKRRLRCKTGHLGTLDPFASGVLPLCLGEATKIAQFLSVADKAYTGVIRLGSETETGDPTGRVTATGPVPQLTNAQLVEVAGRLRGDSLQVPPMYSAIKRQGTPLYKLARQGITVDRQPRAVHIDTLELMDRGDGSLGFSVLCSKGTYVRVLAQQVAACLGSVGHLEVLRRTRFGPFGVEQAITMDTLERGCVPLISPRVALRHLREITLDAAAAERARHGYEPVLAFLDPGEGGEAAKLVGPDGELAAVIVTDRAGRWRFARVIAGRKAAAQ
jgi:tRNA pseudouridine55 synthase